MADGGSQRAGDLLPSAIRDRPSPFRIATRDELWLRGHLVERRLSHGEAIDDGDGIVARDTRDDELVNRCERVIDEMHEVMPRDARVRLVATASSEETSSTMTIGMRGLSVVTGPEHAAGDYELLRAIVDAEPQSETIDYRGIPIVWRNGSAAVLLHEAIGHAKEHDHAPIDWPPWLDVDVPLRMRRASFRDVPLLRMTALVAAVEEGRSDLSGQPGLPGLDSIDVLLVAGGEYEPLSETVSIAVAAAAYRGQRIPPFVIRESREAVARAVIDATGAPIRYPGVVCSREGQELVVGSFAPVMVTYFR
jgi:hypothetical protein